MRPEELAAELGRLAAGRAPARGLEPGRAAPAGRSPLADGVEANTASGRVWVIERPLEEVWPDADRCLGGAGGAVREAARRAAHPELRALASAYPGQLLLLDLETCGLAGAPIFLAGLLHWRAGRPLLTQLFARHYGEEKPLLEMLWRIVAEKRVLVTFNGKSFDWPLVHDRSTVHRVGRDPRLERAAGGGEKGRRDLGPGDARPRPVHCDLLHHARRRWRRRLPNCRLQTLELHVCRRRRVGDLPGREIPQAYEDFVRSGDPWRMRQVLHHNALDLITLLELGLRMVTEG